MDQDSWKNYQIHVLAQLDELKNHAAKANDDHARVRADICELKADIQSFKTSQKWELRILSAIWGLIVMGINAMLGRHG